ncbi:hypothetical protein [Pseudoduganella albidiflava]|uniref:Copper resistance protein CopC n=1 Tax=Pseudoduganella albidiflava TaxID=321983 RepID=A0A411WU05_9BURK|nr:hypothetical protein [Pseudoduganella albidiflava]QBH99976.1 hypothetical protein EYF70_03285 [Pseudoduganella albidiflava]GGY55274.1 hypothetical protein GCM10007387_42240 [Pseudoduganella albidiflava]
MKPLISLLLALAFAMPAQASPGARGPNGEHLDGPAATTASGSVPRVVTFTELFELVGHLSGGELSVMIDRYETNEPVLGGTLDVEYKNLKARAKFHADMGDYAIDDKKFLQALSVPGKHALLFTFTAGGESDLLEGTLEVPVAAADDHGHGHERRWWWLAALPAIAIPAALMVRARRRGAKEVRP